MKLKLITLTVILISFTQVNGKNFSLLHPLANTAESDDHLTLSGILYLEKHKWTLWMNKLQITNNAIPKWLQIDDVNHKTVKGRWKHDGHWYEFNLNVDESLSPPDESIDDTTAMP